MQSLVDGRKRQKQTQVSSTFEEGAQEGEDALHQRSVRRRLLTARRRNDVDIRLSHRLVESDPVHRAVKREQGA